MQKEAVRRHRDHTQHAGVAHRQRGVRKKRERWHALATRMVASQSRGSPTNPISAITSKAAHEHVRDVTARTACAVHKGSQGRGKKHEHATSVLSFTSGAAISGTQMMVTQIARMHTRHGRGASTGEPPHRLALTRMCCIKQWWRVPARKPRGRPPGIKTSRDVRKNPPAAPPVMLRAGQPCALCRTGRNRRPVPSMQATHTHRRHGVPHQRAPAH